MLWVVKSIAVRRRSDHTPLPWEGQHRVHRVLQGAVSLSDHDDFGAYQVPHNSTDHLVPNFSTIQIPHSIPHNQQTYRNPLRIADKETHNVKSLQIPRARTYQISYC